MAIIVFALFPFASAKGQHRIITVYGDTLHCRIISITPTHIHYEQITDGRATGRFIAIEQVVEYLRDGAIRKRDPEVALKPVKPSAKKARQRQRWRIGLHGGGAYLTASLADDEQALQQTRNIVTAQVEEYERKYRNGLFLSGDAHYLFNDYVGIGANYSLFMSSFKMDFLGRDVDVYYQINTKEKYYVNYISPSVIFLQYPTRNRKFTLSEEITLGYAHLRNEVRFEGQMVVIGGYVGLLPNTLITGYTIGGGAKLAFEYNIQPSLSIGLKAGFFYALFDKVKPTIKSIDVPIELDDNVKFDMTRIDYSIGLYYHF
jgi:hypothetical protein